MLGEGRPPPAFVYNNVVLDGAYPELVKGLEQ
jgi:hypothetical protein